jgi:hypothetical protein
MGLLFFGATEALAGAATDLNADTIGCFDNNFDGTPSATWELRGANNAGTADVYSQFGAPGTAFSPVVGRWSGGTTTGLGLYEQVSGTSGVFYVKDDALTSGPAEAAIELVIEPSVSATTPPIPLAGNFGGADQPGVGFYYPDAGVFVIIPSPGNDTTIEPFLFGPVDAGNIYPVVGDWNGDGTDTVGVFNAVSGEWYLTNFFKDGVVSGFQYGPPNSGWIPVTGNWDLLGGDSVGFYDPSTGLFRLRNTNTEGLANAKFAYGNPSTCQPVVGNWNITPP